MAEPESPLNGCSWQIVLQKSFVSATTNFPGCRRSDRMIMWGTTSPCDELIGDFGVGPEVISIGDPRLFCLIAENQSGGVWGLLQHYRHV